MQKMRLLYDGIVWWLFLIFINNIATTIPLLFLLTLMGKRYGFKTPIASLSTESIIVIIVSLIIGSLLSLLILIFIDATHFSNFNKVAKICDSINDGLVLFSATAVTFILVFVSSAAKIELIMITPTAVFASTATTLKIYTTILQS